MLFDHFADPRAFDDVGANAQDVHADLCSSVKSFDEKSKIPSVIHLQFCGQVGVSVVARRSVPRNSGRGAVLRVQGIRSRGRSLEVGSRPQRPCAYTNQGGETVASDQSAPLPGPCPSPAG